MPHYVYVAFAPDGASVSGHLQADSEGAALDQLAGRGLTPVSVRAGGRADEPWWNRDIGDLGRPGQAAPAELERFLVTLATMLGASLPLPRALAFCRSQAGNRAFRAALDRLREGVEGGRALGDAMADEAAFPERLALTVTLGERTNRLAEVAARAAAQLRAEGAAARELRGALVYPTILLAMSGLVLALLTFYLAPTLLPMFETAGAPPPLVLGAMTAAGETILASWVAIGAGLAVLGVALALLRRPLRAALSRLALRLPLVGTWIRQRESAALARTLLLLLSSGATLPAALRAAAAATAHPAYRRLIAQSERTIVEGGTLGRTLGASALIDPMARALIEAGEESDRLPELLGTASEALAARSSASLSRALQLLVPMLTLLIGVGVGALILSVITAILDLNDVAF